MAALLSLILDCFSEKKQQKTVLDAAKAMVDSSQTPIVLCDAKDGTISASRRVETPSRRRRASSPGMMEVGGLFFDFDAPRRFYSALQRRLVRDLRLFHCGSLRKDQ